MQVALVPNVVVFSAPYTWGPITGHHLTIIR
jgi:hypothetical protein